MSQCKCFLLVHIFFVGLHPYVSLPACFPACLPRLGSLGFLSLGTEDVPGNMGVRDQVEQTGKYTEHRVLEYSVSTIGQALE